MTKQAKIIAFANQKGGVGKTTTTINLGAGLALMGKKILIIDFDPQGNSTTSLGIEKDKSKEVCNSYLLLSNQIDPKELINTTIVDNLDIITSSVDLSGAEAEISRAEGDTHLLLKEALKPIMSLYDFIFIDCAPSLGQLTINAFAASNSILIPLQCEFLALEGISHLYETILQMQKVYKLELYMEGVILTMWDGRNNLSREAEKEAREVFGKSVFKTVIRRNIKVAEAPSHGKPIMIYDPKCSGSEDYMNLSKEFIARNKS